MCVLPASHLKVHNTFEKGRAAPGSKVFLRISLTRRRLFFALGGIPFFQLHGLYDEHFMAC
jgi:hypothetical protein